MKKILALAMFAAVAAAAVPAFAGGCCGGSGGCKSPDGFDCSNSCPCAQAANKLRSSGRESMTVSTAVRATLAASLQRNLARV